MAKAPEGLVNWLCNEHPEFNLQLPRCPLYLQGIPIIYDWLYYIWSSHYMYMTGYPREMCIEESMFLWSIRLEKFIFW